ncbi:MAG: sugar phosphate isomerase/epimerase [Cytophagaceae bacterium]|nr:sugar phosphate isomerase/epimerase [Cytophagaceae bacterium]
MNTHRRTFIKQTCKVAGGLAIAGAFPSCMYLEEKQELKISLAQWSLHKAFFSNKISALDFPGIAKTQFGFEAVEYVNQFFKDKAKDNQFLKDLKQRCSDHGVKSILIMIDGEGDLADGDSTQRNQAIENHYKWVEAAKYLECQAIRVNLHGGATADEWKKASQESLSKLTEFASKHGINILAENHGGFSSNAQMLSGVVKETHKKNCGTLADFNNFCVRREKGDLWASPCVDWYDRYKGMEELLPYAKGISVKSMDFDAEGNETSIDYYKMLQLVKKSGYSGYMGIEYEGERLSEEDGIRATKKLVEKALAALK